MIALRWLSAEIAAASLLLAVLLLLASLGGRLLGYLGDAAAGELSAAMVWTFAACRLPEFLQLVLPLAVFLGTALTAGRAHAENELPALEAAGRSPLQLALGLCAVACLPALLVAMLSLGVTPRAQAVLAERMDAAAQDVAEAMLQPGEFIDAGAGRTLFVGAIDPATRLLSDVLIIEEAPGSTVIVRARHALQRRAGAGAPGPVLELRDGAQWRLQVGARDVQRVRFERLHWRLPTVAGATPAPVAARPTAELWRMLRPGAAPGMDAAGAAEFGWRTSLPLACWLAVPLALALGRGRPRAGRFDRLPVAMACFLGYLGVLLLVRAAFARGLPGAGLLLLLAHASVASLAAGLLWRRHRMPS